MNYWVSAMSSSGKTNGAGSIDQLDITADAIWVEFHSITASPSFASSDRLIRFLRFVIDEALADRANRLKEYTIALEVFDQDDSFNPQTNTIVRVHAGRLRRRLERYYLTDGTADEIRIDIPKGGYAPVFEQRFDNQNVSDVVVPPAETRPAPDDVGALPTGPSIAVLPFDNLSVDPEQGYFADGIAEEVLNALTRFSELRVIARHSTFKYKGQLIDVRDVGKDLGADFVLEGSVRKGGDTIRVTAQLLDGKSGEHLYSNTFDRDLTVANVLEIQDDIAGEIVSTIGDMSGVIARTLTQVAKRKPPQQFDSYDAVLQFYEYLSIVRPDLHIKVRDALERAVASDPDYSIAWAALSLVHNDEVRFGFNPRPDANARDDALKAAQTAVVSDPTSSTAYHALFVSHFHRGEIDEFRAAGDRALGLNRNHTDMLADFGLMLTCIGESDRGIAYADKAIALAPVHPGWFHAAAALDHFDKRNHDAALIEAKKIQMNEFYVTHFLIAMVEGQLGHEDEAHDAAGQLLHLMPEFPMMFRAIMNAWNFKEDFIQHAAEGLRNAGLKVQ